MQQAADEWTPPGAASTMDRRPPAHSKTSLPPLRTAHACTRPRPSPYPVRDVSPVISALLRSRTAGIWARALTTIENSNSPMPVRGTRLTTALGQGRRRARSRLAARPAHRNAPWVRRRGTRQASPAVVAATPEASGRGGPAVDGECSHGQQLIEEDGCEDDPSEGDHPVSFTPNLRRTMHVPAVRDRGYPFCPAGSRRSAGSGSAG